MIAPTVVLGIVLYSIGICLVPITKSVAICLEVCCGYSESDIEQKFPRFYRLREFWFQQCLGRVKKIFRSPQQTHNRTTLMLKVFAVQVRRARLAQRCLTAPSATGLCRVHRRRFLRPILYGRR